jgi:hypothetical protein
VTTTPGGISAENDLMYRLAQRTGETLLLLPTRTTYRGTCKQYSVVRVQKDYRLSIAENGGETKRWDFWQHRLHTPNHCRSNGVACGGLKPYSVKNGENVYDERRLSRERFKNNMKKRKGASPCVRPCVPMNHVHLGTRKVTRGAKRNIALYMILLNMLYSYIGRKENFR